MGQRHQVYVVNKTKEGYRCIGAFHHQWCYGFTAAAKLIQLVHCAQRAKTADDEWSDYYLRDAREVDVLVKAIYGISDEGVVSMVHNENEHLIDSESNPTPENGDNNDGAALVVIDNENYEVRGCLFTPQSLEGDYGAKCKAWKSYTPEQYAAFYYTEMQLIEAMNGGDNRAGRVFTMREAPIKPVTQGEFNKIMAKSIGGK